MRFRRTAKNLSKILSSEFERQISINPRQIQTFHAITEGSEKAMRVVKPYVRTLLKQNGLKQNCAVNEGPCKKLVRFFSKAVSKHDGDISKVPDVGRIRVLIESPEDITTLRKLFLGNKPRYINTRKGVLIDQHPTNNITIREFEDFYYVPSSTGRIALHIGLDVTIDGKQKVPFEIQVIHKDMLNTEEFTRDNYISKQVIERKTLLEKRLATESEKKAIKGYDDSSKRRYTADAYKYDLFKLRRPGLGQQKKINHYERTHTATATSAYNLH